MYKNIKIYRNCEEPHIYRSYLKTGFNVKEHGNIISKTVILPYEGNLTEMKYEHIALKFREFMCTYRNEDEQPALSSVIEYLKNRWYVGQYTPKDGILEVYVNDSGNINLSASQWSSIGNDQDDIFIIE